jgi:hypothetical protein
MAIATLPLVVAVVLTELAVGGAFLLWFLERREPAPRGFVRLVAIVDAVAIGLAALLIPTFPRGELAERAGIDVGAVGAFGQALIVLAVLLGLQLVSAFLPWRAARGPAGLAAFAVGALVLAVAALARPSDAPYDVFALAALPLGALALGGADAAMLLGHWYLVTPKLPVAPLQRAALVIVAAVALQLGLVAVALVRGELVGSYETGLLVAIGIRIGVGLAMTMLLALGAWWTARMNTQSATGLLYVAVGTALAGEVSARVIFFLTGAAV